MEDENGVAADADTQEWLTVVAGALEEFGHAPACVDTILGDANQKWVLLKCCGSYFSLTREGRVGEGGALEPAAGMH